MSRSPVTSRPPDTETCGCCDGIGPSTPSETSNRMGLSAVAYRVGEYADFKESLVSGLSSSAYALKGLKTRNDDDFTMGLLDAAACAADVLSFYQERIANESYLRTATERVSLQEMARLIGYRLRPGLTAETWLAFALETPRTAPPDLPPEPGAFVTGIPTELTLPPGLRVQSVPGPDEKPQIFETVEEIVGRPEWNTLRPWLSEPQLLARGDQETWLEDIQNNLKAGDALVFVGTEFAKSPEANNNWDFRLIDEVRLDPRNHRTHVHWTRGLGSRSPVSNPAGSPKVYVLRKRVGVFGNNAPAWASMSADFKETYLHKRVDPGEWIDFKTSGAKGAYLDLDSVVSDATVGGLVVLAKGEFNRPDEETSKDTYVELYKITSTTELSRAEFAVSGKITRLGLDGQNLEKQFCDADAVRATSVYVVSQELPLAPYPVTDNVIGDTIPLNIAGDHPQVGRRILVLGKQADSGSPLAHPCEVTAVTANPNGVLLTVAPPLPTALRRESVVVHANVALATHGETVAQILGQGEASQSFQRFELKRVPLTYRGATNDFGAKSELGIRVGDVEWTEKPTLFDAAVSDRVYTVTTDETGKTWAVFGDGIRGARLPSGVNNVRARYRQGLGQEGNVSADKLTQLMTRPLGLKSVSNPISAQGGTNPEAADHARTTMPLGTRTLGRAVSLLDYEDFSMAYSGIEKAQASVLHLPAGPTIAITVAGQDGTETGEANPVWNNLWRSLREHGDPHVRVLLLPYHSSTFRLGLTIKRDPPYDRKATLAAVDAALRAHFSFASRSLGQPVLQSEVIAVVHSVPGVVAVDLDFLYGGSAPSSQTGKSRQTRLLASQMRVLNGVALASELLTLHPAPLERLEEMP